MTDQNAKDGKQPVSITWMMRSRGEPTMKPSDKVVPLVPPQGAPRDWSSAIELVREASDAVRFSEERANDLEQQLQELTKQATEEIQRLEARIAAGEEQLGKAEERVRAAEQRASVAESWLVRLHDAITEAFPRQNRQAGKHEGPSEQQVARS